VIVSPDGPLCYVPLAVLVPGRSLTLTPSASTHLLLGEEAGDPGEGVLALGDPVYEAPPEGEASSPRGGALTPLPQTREEAKAVGDVLLFGEEANEGALAERLATCDRWRAVHLAGHGLVDRERPTMSSLAISRTARSDGLLTGIEILRLRIAADLAVLSACETGRGKVVAGGGIMGLTRAFMYAGSSRVLCSLWNPKEGESMPCATALRQAQEHVRSHEKWKHPAYWAAWVLCGLPQ
jgi:CHAT domain-containing protein